MYLSGQSDTENAKYLYIDVRKCDNSTGVKCLQDEELEKELSDLRLFILTNSQKFVSKEIGAKAVSSYTKFQLIPYLKEKNRVHTLRA